MDPLQTITLVVKAPNQKIDDQTVECVAGWTVRKLKSHLSNVYPNKPPEKDQKIIYSGKLLHDHLALKDILRQYEECNAHTVHLVCATSVANMTAGNGNGNGNGTSNHNTSNPTASDNGTHLRHRNVANAQGNGMQQPPQLQQQAHHPFNPFMFNMMMQYQQPHQQANVPHYMPQYQHHHHHHHQQQQHQAMWMQHMYMQHMSQYMHYMSQSGVGQIPETAVEEPQPNQNVAPPQPQQANENRANNQPANQNVRMNAGVGGPPMDDDEEEMNRDWLDYVYMFCRFGLLLSIVYFYSSIDRFLLVMGFVALMYLYQGGWFRVRRRQIRRNSRAPPAQAQEPPQEEQPVASPTDSPDETPPSEDQPQEETSSNDDDVATEQTGTDDSDDSNQEPQPGVMETAWNFVSTFFTSLIPHGPPEFPN